MSHEVISLVLSNPQDHTKGGRGYNNILQAGLRRRYLDFITIATNIHGGVPGTLTYFHALHVDRYFVTFVSLCRVKNFLYNRYQFRFMGISHPLFSVIREQPDFPISEHQPHKTRVETPPDTLGTWCLCFQGFTDEPSRGIPVGVSTFLTSFVANQASPRMKMSCLLG